MRRKSPLTLPELNELLAFRHDELLARFKKEFGFDTRFSKKVFKDLLRYLWLSAWGELQPKPVPNVMFTDVMDEMWHMFLLFTEDYRDFCLRYFGVFMHHSPSQILSARDSSEVRQSESRQAVQATWSMLGPDTARRWYADYQEQYPTHVLRELQFKEATKRRRASS